MLAARQFPDVPMIWSSGDNAWVDGARTIGPDLPNLGNVMGEMEYGKMIAGCAAALTSESGNIGYVGPLINDETRRLVNSAYLGARYCWENCPGKDAADLTFGSTGSGSGSTSQASRSIRRSSRTTSSTVAPTCSSPASTPPRHSSSPGSVPLPARDVWAIPYDFVAACDSAPEVCLGTPWFNWGPSYLEIAQSVIDGTFEATFQWLPSGLGGPQQPGDHGDRLRQWALA